MLLQMMRNHLDARATHKFGRVATVIIMVRESNRAPSQELRWTISVVACWICPIKDYRK